MEPRTTLPHLRRAPTDPVALEVWLTALSEGKWQGCGHMKFMIELFSTYGLPSPELPQFVIRAFYKFWCARGPTALLRPAAVAPAPAMLWRRALACTSTGAGGTSAWACMYTHAAAPRFAGGPSL